MSRWTEASQTALSSGSWNSLTNQRSRSAAHSGASFTSPKLQRAFSARRPGEREEAGALGEAEEGLETGRLQVVDLHALRAKRREGPLVCAHCVVSRGVYKQTVGEGRGNVRWRCGRGGARAS